MPVAGAFSPTLPICSGFIPPITAGKNLSNQAFFTFSVMKYKSASSGVSMKTWTNRVLSFDFKNGEVINVEKGRVNRAYKLDELLDASSNITIEGKADPLHLNIRLTKNREYKCVTQSKLDAAKLVKLIKAVRSYINTDRAISKFQENIGEYFNVEQHAHDRLVLHTGYVQVLSGSSLLICRGTAHICPHLPRDRSRRHGGSSTGFRWISLCVPSGSPGIGLQKLGQTNVFGTAGATGNWNPDDKLDPLGPRFAVLCPGNP